MKKWIWMTTVVCFIAALLLTACSSPVNSAAAGAAGFHKPDQVVKGGSPSETTNINIKEITTTQNRMRIPCWRSSFCTEAAIPEKTKRKSTAIPEYEVSCLGVPDRLLVRIKGISYYDFDETKVPNDMVQSVMKVPWVYDEYFDLYFNLAQQSEFKVEEAKDRIKITLHPTKAAQEKGFFATPGHI